VNRAAVIGLAIVAAAAVSAAWFLVKRETWAGGTIRTAVGRKVTFKLGSNHSTGYAWQLAEPLDETVVQLVDRSYRSEGSKPGSGGSETWTLRAVGPGTATVRLKCVRPWEPEQRPSMEDSVVVMVTAR
jgi:predicted secreted protein